MNEEYNGARVALKSTNFMNFYYYKNYDERGNQNVFLCTGIAMDEDLN